jgi:hypothetical protein
MEHSPLEEVDHVAARVAEDLEFHMTGALQVFFEEDARVAKRTLRFPPGRGQRFAQLRPPAHDAHALATAPGSGFQHDGIPNPVRLLGQLGLVHRVVRPVPTGHHRHPGIGQRGPGDDFVAHGPNHLRRWPDEGQPGACAGLGKPAVLGKKPVARMDRLDPVGPGQRDDGRPVQIGVRRCDPGQMIGFVRRAHVRSRAVRIGIDHG